jgi:putative ABC transport system ATP-binding protein
MLDDGGDTFSVGMNPVRLHHAVGQSRAFEKKRIKDHVVACGEIGIDRAEILDIVLAQIARRLHAREQDREALRLKLLEDGRKCPFRPLGRKPLERIVAAEFDDDRARIFGKRPVQPLERGRSGVAGNAGIHHRDIVSARLQRRFKLRRERLILRQAESRGQTVAERDDHLRPRLCRDSLRRKPKGCDQKGEDKDEALHLFDLFTLLYCRSAWHLSAHRSMEQQLKQHKQAAIKLDDLHVTLPSRAGPVAILRGIDLAVPEGEAVAIVGPSGSGKSTLLMVVAGLERATEGRVEVMGTDYAALDEDGLARLRAANIGIVFQSFHLVPTMTALENVALPLEFLDRDDAYGEAKSALAEVGLSHRESHFPGQLSGGEQQRVAIARALAPRPALILADEPTGNLDLATGAEVMDLLFGLREKTGATLLLITHDRSLAKRCDRIVSLADGRIVGAGAKRKVSAP